MAFLQKRGSGKISSGNSMLRKPISQGFSEPWLC